MVAKKGCAFTFFSVGFNCYTLEGVDMYVLYIYMIYVLFKTYAKGLFRTFLACKESSQQWTNKFQLEEVQTMMYSADDLNVAPFFDIQYTVYITNLGSKGLNPVLKTPKYINIMLVFFK